MGMLIDGQWHTTWYEPDNDGRFVRPRTVFRDQITADGSSGYTAEAGRYHLYVSLACPWAHRTLLVRKLRGLEDILPISIVDPFMDDQGWRFTDGPGCIPDPHHNARYLRDIYLKADPRYTGRVTVPVLWDTRNGTIVNNESAEIIRMLDVAFAHLGHTDVNFAPPELLPTIDDTIRAIYEPINNGVYRCGFATTQRAYDEAVASLFEALDHWDGALSSQRYLCGDVLTEADWCMFTTLIRFDVVYATHFKCNIRRIVDYHHLWNYLKALYQRPGVAQTCNFDHIKQHYFRSHETINPHRIVPAGPLIDFNAPHDRV